jgi:hypothetical protein
MSVIKIDPIQIIAKPEFWKKRIFGRNTQTISCRPDTDNSCFRIYILDPACFSTTLD